ncbi:unnamed protein product [Caenorhabditis nigoni]|uniref:Uncharacterized protein n=1 Tax=Caenorhabditis nigoni TaxID=1611254 RepID=A0A2G5SPP9_9PELO|nr:hypothetical protein B9Z55_023463 [Caenorhabditis nigoni]PIC17106.1 hypothetical protein B9Z55_023464 [Caenorhabditis nigoni]
MEQISQKMEQMEIAVPGSSDSNFDQDEHNAALKLQAEAIAQKRENGDADEYTITNFDDFEFNYAKFQKKH